MKLPALIIFDMDGVLVDSEPMYRQMNLQLLTDRGADVSELNYDAYIGGHAWDMWAELRNRYNLTESVEELVELEKNSKREILRNDPIHPVPGAMSLLEELKRDGHPLAVASSSLRVNVELVLERLNIRSLFGVIVSGEEVKNGKPAPDIFLRAAQLSNVVAESSWVIEDSLNGVRAAKSAGMKVIGYSSPASGTQDLSAADHIVRDLSRIKTAMFRA